MTDPSPPTAAADLARAALLSGPPPRAASFIVTIYGDVVEPRGGTLWMGTLIECCADHGLSESLVRTAVSRLVAAGRLAGERIGRRSYYRLTPAAQREFAGAARILYAPPPPPEGWLVALGPAALAAASLSFWARLGPEAACAPDRADIERPDGLVMTATPLGVEKLPDFAASQWPLGEVAASYRAVAERLAPLSRALSAGPAPAGALALALRLRLVHLYRQAALADPRLPRAALPPDWPGSAARAHFVSLYNGLARPADTHIGHVLHGDAGLLDAETPATRRRLDSLAAEALR